MVSTALRVKELLKERSWTTKVLSEKTGMSESYLTHIKNGTRRWNEDALKKIAGAFELDPVDLFAVRRERSSLGIHTKSLEVSGVIADQLATLSAQITKVPLMGEIPTYPSVYNNEITQTTTGYKEMFVPVLGTTDPTIFAFCVENNSMAPNFIKGDYLIFSPEASVQSGDIIVAEYKNDRTHKNIVQVNFVDDFIVLESINHRQPPIALAKGKDNFRIIGKLIYRYQKFN